MSVRLFRILVRAMGALCLAAGAAALADDIRPESRERPLSDEKCIEQCDLQSDQCMQASNGDPDKVQVCDDQYSRCLQACDAR